jgi:hypothetical protein
MIVRLVCWKGEEAEEKAARMRGFGWTVETSTAVGAGMDVMVIDLGRLPSQGREVGVRMRQGRATRGIPLVFVGGEEAKVERVRRELPDAVYCGWGEIGAVVPGARAGTAAVVGHMERYAGTPVAQKQGRRRRGSRSCWARWRLGVAGRCCSGSCGGGRSSNGFRW